MFCLQANLLQHLGDHLFDRVLQQTLITFCRFGGAGNVPVDVDGLLSFVSLM